MTASGYGEAISAASTSNPAKRIARYGKQVKIKRIMRMTPQEARETLEAFKNSGVPDGELLEAIETAIEELPGTYNGKPTAKMRFVEISDAVTKAKDGWTPFNPSRDAKSAAWRQAIIAMLRHEGYTLYEIGRAVGKHHSTVVYSIKRVRDGLDVGDHIFVNVWRQLNDIAK